MAEKKTFFISTSIPYVNAAPHLGHALEFVQADIIARFHRLKDDEVFFLSGTDDNALKNVQAAEKEGKEVREYVAENAKHFEDLAKALNISNDDFIKTSSDPRHLAGAQKLWSACKPDIYAKKYKGLYCIGCEEFKTEKDLVNGECPEHPGKKLEEVEEENYFFNLKKYASDLRELIEPKDGSEPKLKIVPEIRKNETLAFIDGGLEDFSISRSKERARGWGMPVPEDEDQIMYVWFDALSNYINALGYAENSEQYQKFWVQGDEQVHAIGKGINRFHTIYWPAMLLSAGVPVPKTVFIHGYITVDGQKMSKSIGNVIDPNDLIKEYGAEAVRYFFANKISTFEDSDITLERIKEWYTADLANGIGNLASRILQMSSQHLESTPELPNIKDESTLTGTGKRVLRHLELFEISRAVFGLWSWIADLDVLIQETKPFEVVKTNKAAAQNLLTNTVKQLGEIAVLLEPFMPDTSKKILEAIKDNKKPENLFPRKD